MLKEWVSTWNTARDECVAAAVITGIAETTAGITTAKWRLSPAEGLGCYPRRVGSHSGGSGR